MKHLNFFKTTLLLCALIVGSTYLWGEETLKRTLDFTSQSNWNIPTSGTNTSRASFTDGTTTIYLYAVTNYKLNNGYLLLGKSGSYLELPAFDFNVTKIEVVGTSGASGSVKQNVYVGETAVSTETTGAKNVTHTYNIASNYQTAGTIYQLKVTSNHNTQISTLKIYGEEGGSQETVVSPTFSVPTGTYANSTSVGLSCSTDGATIYYTTDGTDPTTSTSRTAYASDIIVNATTTIKAIAVKDGMTDSSVATATYTIVSIEHAGTAEDPYTVADAINFIATLGTSTSSEVYVSGIISQIDSYNSTYSSITYWISDDGITNQLEVYSGLGLNGAGFSAQTDLQVGDIVTVKGNVQMYNTTTPEFNYNNVLVSFYRPENTTPSISVASNSIEATAESANGTINVTYNNITSVVAEIVMCDAEGNNASYDWVSASINASNNIEYSIDANTGDARTAYMKVHAPDNEANDVYSELITISQAAYVAPAAPVDFIYAKVTATDQITDGQYLIVYEGDASHNAVAFNGSLATLDAANNGVAVTIAAGIIAGSDELEASEFTIDVTAGTILSASEYYIGKTANANGLDANKSTQYTNTFSIDGNGNAVITASGNCILRYNYGKSDLRFRYYKSGQQAIALYKRCNLVLGTNGYSTYAAGEAFTVSGATAYKAKYEDGVVMLTEVSGVIPANTGIILHGTEGAPVTITPSSDEEVPALTDNALVGVVEATTAPANAYVLATIDDDNVTKFHPCAGVEIPAHKAYIVISGGNSAPVRIVFAEDNATNISNIENADDAVKFIENGVLYIRRNGVVYTTTGQVVR